MSRIDFGFPRLGRGEQLTPMRYLHLSRNAFGHVALREGRFGIIVEVSGTYYGREGELGEIPVWDVLA